MPSARCARSSTRRAASAAWPACARPTTASAARSASTCARRTRRRSSSSTSRPRAPSTRSTTSPRSTAIDVVFLGPADLSQSLGVPGEVRHPVVLEHLERAAAATLAAGKALGVTVPDAEAARAWIERGATYVTTPLEACSAAGTAQSYSSAEGARTRRPRLGPAARPATGAESHYGAHYREFADEVYSALRRAEFGDDFGQNNWLTLPELERFASQLELAAGVRLLDVACGAGGPALHLAELTGCAVTGVDLEDECRRQCGAARRRGRPRGTGALPAGRREQAAAARGRLLRGDPLPGCAQPPAGPPCRVRRLGALADARRPAAVHRRCHRDGARRQPRARDPQLDRLLRLRPARHRRAAPDRGRAERTRHRGHDGEHGGRGAPPSRRAPERAETLRRLEGDEPFERRQGFLEMVARLADERRVSRFTYLAEKPRA